EGTDPELIEEYTTVKGEKLVRTRFCAIHCTALGQANFDDWHASVIGSDPVGRGSLIWSPFSNLWLSTAPTAVVTPRKAGLRICLGADWSPSGSKNLLGELKVADLWNRTALKKAFTPRALCEMVTCNPADALGWGDRLGRLRSGLHAD